ncbi:MAG: hypothetical protein ACHBN1_09285 [Heteroscytonema crispum UTEX LB 1556]
MGDKGDKGDNSKSQYSILDSRFSIRSWIATLLTKIAYQADKLVGNVLNLGIENLELRIGLVKGFRQSKIRLEKL